MDIAKLDKNFATRGIPEGLKDTVKYYDAEEAPFKIYGLPYGYADRFPKTLEITENLRGLSVCTAGGRIRFKTDSDYIIIKVAVPSVCLMSHMTLTGSLGCDAYAKEENGYVYLGSFIPPSGTNGANEVLKSGGYEAAISFSEKKMRDITINLPLYNPVDKLWIGINEKAKLKKPDEYAYKTPVVYYGSSITQGGCASRPGNSYQAMLTRWYDMDHINLGFSGNAKGETNVAEHIASMKMSAFVYDYDHNAPTVEHLRATHKPMFDIIRKKNPDLPIIMATRPKEKLSQEEIERWKIIRNTYMSAKKAGDTNVYFVDGTKMFKGRGGDSCTVDGCHPNDLGFYAMAIAFDKALKKVGFERK